MTKPKITESQAQKLLEIVRYTLDYHEWCEQPRREFPCGHNLFVECDEDAQDVCEGCSMQRKAEAAAKWERGR